MNAEVENREQREVQKDPRVIGKAGVRRVEAEHVGFQVSHAEVNEDPGPQNLAEAQAGAGHSAVRRRGIAPRKSWYVKASSGVSTTIGR